MKLADKTLKNLQDKKTFVDIFTDAFNESLYGFIRKFNDKYLLLEHYNDDSQYDGIVVFRREDISRLRWGNNEINGSFECISGSLQPGLIKKIDIKSIATILTSVEKCYGLVSIYIQNVDDSLCIIGAVEQIDGSTVVIKEFGTKASRDRGTIMLSLSDITRVAAGGIYENNLLKVHKVSRTSR